MRDIQLGKTITEVMEKQWKQGSLSTGMFTMYMCLLFSLSISCLGRSDAIDGGCTRRRYQSCAGTSEGVPLQAEYIQQGVLNCGMQHFKRL